MVAEAVLRSWQLVGLGAGWTEGAWSTNFIPLAPGDSPGIKFPLRAGNISREAEQPLGPPPAHIHVPLGRAPAPPLQLKLNIQFVLLANPANLFYL